MEQDFQEVRLPTGSLKTKFIFFASLGLPTLCGCQLFLNADIILAKQEQHSNIENDKKQLKNKK